MPKLFDVKVYELAQYFLSGRVVSQETIKDLAEAIQGQIEDWFEDFDDK